MTLLGRYNWWVPKLPRLEEFSRSTLRRGRARTPVDET
jgi:hypothetical protein